jgi:hypothetical protein
MSKAHPLTQGREALNNQQWSSAFLLLMEADQKTPLCPEDLEGLATAAYLTGKEEESADILARAHQGFLTKGETRAPFAAPSGLDFCCLSAENRPRRVVGCREPRAF